MSKYYLGIDLGSTTSKAIIINEKDEIVGRGITNTRANYKVAADIARLEAEYDVRFTLLSDKLKDKMAARPEYKKYMEDIRSVFQYLQFEHRVESLRNELQKSCKGLSHERREEVAEIITGIMNRIVPTIRVEFVEHNLGSKNQFFRDIVGEYYNNEVDAQDKTLFEPLMLAFDKSITPVENEMVEYDFGELVRGTIDILQKKYSSISDDTTDAELKMLKNNYQEVQADLEQYIDEVAAEEIHISNMVGTGYGRALLPFPESCIKSEILCHAFGAHAIFPNTRTVLDIGGQDTKAIQVDSHGLVTSFHMNDRCAAGCGRYLGYIADEFSISLNELGPMALECDKETNICSTCTVFAGAEVRELLNVGEKRSNILAGLHKAIVMRAMSLLARSGGVRNEFTFTGGVARNQAVLKYVGQMVKDSYGDVTMNIHHDSIFMGALGGAMFARRNIETELPKKEKKARKSVKN